MWPVKMKSKVPKIIESKESRGGCWCRTTGEVVPDGSIWLLLGGGFPEHSLPNRHVPRAYTYAYSQQPVVAAMPVLTWVMCGCNSKQLCTWPIHLSMLNFRLTVRRH